MEFSMTSIVAVYGAAVATVVLIFDIYKWKRDRTHLTLSCYLGKMVNNMLVPSGGRLHNGTSYEEDLRLPRYIIYDIKNTGGIPITIRGLGGKEMDGELFVVAGGSLILPQRIEPHASVSIPVPLNEAPESIQEFCVTDAIGRDWRCKARVFQRQLAEYQQKAGDQ